jgi:hypothetical protein
MPTLVRSWPRGRTTDARGGIYKLGPGGTAMKTPMYRHLGVAAVLASALIDAVSDDIGYEAARRLRKEGVILPLEEIVARASARWPRQCDSQRQA